MISTCVNRICDAYTALANIPETYGKKILRLCVFQHPENGGQFELCIMRIYKFLAQRICSTGYDPKRAERGWNVLEQLGAKTSFIPVENHSINAVEWDPNVLEEKINNLGGVWERFALDGQTVLAIRPPENPSEEWQTLESNLRKFWPKQDGLIITCASAEEVTDDEKLFIQVNSASTSYIMLREKMALFVGCKKKYVSFDPPGTGLSKNTGIATEGAYYATIKAVYEKFAQPYFPEDVWVGGACLGCASAAYLRSQIPDINLILENGFVNLKEDMVKREGSFVYWFSSRFWDCLFRGTKEESEFNIVKTWESVSHSSLGKIVVVSVENDQHVSREVTQKLIAEAEKINKKVFDEHYFFEGENPHFSRFEKQPLSCKNVLHYIFQTDGT